MGYRLPTEAEWEYAARGGEAFVYAGSDDAEAVAWTRRNAEASQVGCTRDANAWGLCDMSGNVWEWVHDWYGADYYAESEAEDPLGPIESANRVARGGSWSLRDGEARVASRERFVPTFHEDELGFRLAKSRP